MAMAAWVWAYVVQDGVNELITKENHRPVQADDDLNRESSAALQSSVVPPR